MTTGEEIQAQIFANLLEREGKTVAISRAGVTTNISALISTNRVENEKPGVDLTNREHVEIWVSNTAITPPIVVGETLTAEGKNYRVQKRYPGPIKTALICKVSEA